MIEKLIVGISTTDRNFGKEAERTKIIVHRLLLKTNQLRSNLRESSSVHLFSYVEALAHVGQAHKT